MAAPLRSTLVLSLALSSFGLATAPVAAAQAPAKPDQVFRTDPRSGKVVAVAGRVEQDGLDRVVLVRRDGNQGRYESAQVVEVVYGDVPPSFRDAQRYVARGDHENAVARFRVAAGDASTRDVVQAAARLRAVETLLDWGASDPTRFNEAAEEAARFVADHPTNREVPHARYLEARAKWLAGDAAGAATGFRALFDEGQSGTEGYGVALTMQAGLDAALAALAAGDAGQGRDAFDALSSAVTGVDTLDLPAATRARLEAIAAFASLGSGFVQLAEGQGDRAETYFAGKADSLESGPGKNAARLGLGEALLAQGKFREAQLELAQAAALMYASDDLEARALVGMAQAARSLGDATSAKKTLERVIERHGATPAARRAADLLQSL